MGVRLDAVNDLKDLLSKTKQAFLQVPPHPDHAPQAAMPADPSQQPGAAPPPGGMPADPSQQPGAAPPPGGMPADPNQQSMPAQPPAEPPAVPTEMAAVMDQLLTRVEELGQGVKAWQQETTERMSKLESELQNEARIRDERRKVIQALAPEAMGAA